MSLYEKNGGPFHPQNDMSGRPMIPGVTLRDWFAGQALTAMLNSRELRVGLSPETTAEMWAGMAFRVADAMIAERSK